MMTDQAFEEAILGLVDTMYRICYAQLRSHADREDAVQEALKKAWEKRKTLKDEGALRGWMLRILINECHNIQRKNKRMRPAEYIPDQVLPPPDADSTLHDLVLSLPEKLRITAVLVFMEGMTGAQAAQILRLPQGTVSSRIHKARKLLMDQWKEANRE